MSPNKKNSLLPIKIQNLFYFTQKRNLLNNLNCSIISNGITVIMGPNGSGKSLFLRCLHGISNFKKGKIFFSGKELNKEIRLSQSMVFQTPILLKRSVINNLLFVSRQRKMGNKNKVKSILKEVELSHLSHESAIYLSGGEKQRLCLARALITEPQILLLDEATSNLDPYSINIIEKIIKKISKHGTKIIAITHDIGQARRIAADIILLHKGKICEYTNAKRFFHRPFSKEGKLFLEGKIII